MAKTPTPPTTLGFSDARRCRIVEYTAADGDVMPAIITKIDGDELHVTSFDRMGPRMWVLSLEQDWRPTCGEDPKTWNWPARS